VNTITSIHDEDGRNRLSMKKRLQFYGTHSGLEWDIQPVHNLFEHEEKAEVLWNTFRNRMGHTTSPEVLFNLEEMMHESIDLAHLAEPFTNEEIDQVIKEMKSERAPGPYGLNAHLLKKCGHIIIYDFYQLYHNFSKEYVPFSLYNTKIRNSPRHSKKSFKIHDMTY
jgi:hypothetical protein